MLLRQELLFILPFWARGSFVVNVLLWENSTLKKSAPFMVDWEKVKSLSFNIHFEEGSNYVFSMTAVAHCCSIEVEYVDWVTFISISLHEDHGVLCLPAFLTTCCHLAINSTKRKAKTVSTEGSLEDNLSKTTQAQLIYTSLLRSIVSQVRLK